MDVIECYKSVKPMDKLDIRIIDILDRLEDAKKVLGMGDDLEEAIRKLQRMELYLKRFGNLPELTAHLEIVESKLYSLKEFLTIDEASDYLGLAQSTIYKMTSRREIPVYKPNDKQVLIQRDDLNNWIRKSKIMSAEELDEYAKTHLLDLTEKRKAKKNSKK